MTELWLMRGERRETSIIHLCKYPKLPWTKIPPKVYKPSHHTYVMLVELFLLLVAMHTTIHEKKKPCEMKMGTLGSLLPSFGVFGIRAASYNMETDEMEML